MQTANATAQDRTSEGCPIVWWRHRVGEMSHELGVLPRTLGFSWEPNRGESISSSVLWPCESSLSLASLPGWRQRTPPASQTPYHRSLVLAGPCLSRQALGGTEVSFRHPHHFCQEDADCKVFSRPTTVYWKVHKTWTNESKLLLLSDAPDPSYSCKIVNCIKSCLT